MRRFYPIFQALLFIALGYGVSSANLVIFNLTGAPGNQLSQSPASTDPNVTATALVRGSGVTASDAANSILATGWTTGSVLDPNDYFGFSVTPNPNFAMNITSLRFAERRSAAGIREIDVRYSTDGFSTSTSILADTIPDNASPRQRDISIITLNNIVSTVEFRIFGFLSESGAGTFRLENNSAASGIVLAGSTFTAVPEPASLAGAMMLFGTWVLRRRSRGPMLAVV